MIGRSLSNFNHSSDVFRSCSINQSNLTKLVIVSKLQQWRSSHRLYLAERARYNYLWPEILPTTKEKKKFSRRYETLSVGRLLSGSQNFISTDQWPREIAEVFQDKNNTNSSAETWCLLNHTLPAQLIVYNFRGCAPPPRPTGGAEPNTSAVCVAHHFLHRDRREISRNFFHSVDWCRIQL